MNRIKIYGIISMLALLSSCDDFLKEVSQDEFEPKTTAAFRELMKGEGYIINATDPITYMVDDDVDGCKSTYWTAGTRVRQNLFEWQPDYWRLEDESSTILPTVTGSYKHLYKTIAACNIIIENVLNSDGTQEEKDIVMAEAKTMRAFYYWKLVNTYALPYNDKLTSPNTNPGVPLVLQSEVKETGMPRATVAEVYNQIEADIEEACRLFGDDTTDRGKYRVSYTAAHLFASRVHLFMEHWDKAIEHADKALAKAPKLCNLPRYTIDNVNSPTNGVISVKFPETIFICGMKATNGECGLMGTPYNVSTSLSSSFTIMDSRANVYIRPSGYDYPYRILKFCADEHEFTWRTAELYLNRAEAELELYKQGNAEAGNAFISDMEALMSTRYLMHTAPTLSSSAEELQQLLRSERRKELCFEGIRFFDLKRYGMPSYTHTVVGESGSRTVYTLEERDEFYCIPFPDEALDHNEALVQNPLHPHRVGVAE